MSKYHFYCNQQYLDQYDVDSAESAVWSNPRLVATELKLRLHGAEISKTLSADVTHVVVDSSRLERGPAIKVCHL